VEIEFRSDIEDNDDDDGDDDDSDDDMPDLVSSPRASAASKAKAVTTTKSAFPVRKVRFGNIEAEDLVDENGHVRDGYDYSKHMKEMGKGKFYSADGQFSTQSELARRIELPDDVLPSTQEQDRLLDAITLTTDLMDQDLREALINDEAFEEIDDDFMVQAATADADDDDANDGVDYDAHIAKLMEAASGVPKYKGDLSDDEEEFDEDDEEFSDEDDERDLDDAEKAEQQRVLDALFEKTLAEEYDDEQLGELEEDDPETRGELVLEGELLDAIVEDFVTVRLEMLHDEGKVGNPLRSGNRLKEILEECEKERELEEADGDANDTLPEDDDDESARQSEELEQTLQALYTRNAYLTAREDEQWDCETIVSTYSNLDNHPTLLREESAAKKKKKSKSSALAALDDAALAALAKTPSKIVLSKKTGMPLGVFESAAKDDEEDESARKRHEAVAALSQRARRESKEDKKVRKEAVRQLKTQRRVEKKQWKDAFKDEEQRQRAQTPGGRVSVFKY
jgi:protein LTV1